LSDALREDEIFNLRPEQLEQFIALTQKIEADGV
jgi:16S rRNA (adenine1518-N6/adenine1519-N6)-dimethyltransferase